MTSNIQGSVFFLICSEDPKIQSKLKDRANRMTWVLKCLLAIQFSLVGLNQGGCDKLGYFSEKFVVILTSLVCQRCALKKELFFRNLLKYLEL